MYVDSDLNLTQDFYYNVLNRSLVRVHYDSILMQTSKLIMIMS